MGSTDMATTGKALRASIIAHGARIVEAALGGAPAATSLRGCRTRFLITPSGAQYAALRPAMIAQMPLAGEYGAWKGPMKPSGEWRIHLDIARARPDIGAIVRIQSPDATALAMAHKSIPAAHSMIALFGSSVIRSPKYARAARKSWPPRPEASGGERSCGAPRQLSGADDRRTLEMAVARAIGLESFAKLYAIAFSVGRPLILSDEEVARVAERLKSNGADIEARIVGMHARRKPHRPPKGGKEQVVTIKAGSGPLSLQRPCCLSLSLLIVDRRSAVGGGRSGDHRGFFSSDSGQADRTNQLRKERLRQSGRPHLARRRARLVAEPIRLTKAQAFRPQRLRHDFEIEAVGVRHHDDERAVRGVGESGTAAFRAWMSATFAGAYSGKASRRELIQRTTNGKRRERKARRASDMASPNR